MRKVLQQLKQYKRNTFLCIGLTALEVIMEILMPFVTAIIIDRGLEVSNLPVVYRYGALMVLMAFLSLIFGAMAGKNAASASSGLSANLREAIYANIQTFSFSNIDKFSVPGLVTRMTTDVTVLQNAVNGGLRPLARGPVMLILGVGLSFWMSARLALVFLVCIPALAVILFCVVRKVAPMYGRLQQSMDHMNNMVQEGLAAIRAVKAFVRGDYEAEKFQAVNRELTATSQRTFHYAVLNLPAFQLVMYLATVLLMWFGGNMVLGGTLQVGDLTGVLSYVMQVMNSLMMISNVFLLLTRSLASARRIAEVLDEPAAITSPQGAVTAVPDGSVEFRRVSFKYHAGAKAYALSGVDLRMEAGQTVGILGGTGSAKSTLVQLIPRLYDVTEGAVLVGGRDVREYDLQALRDAVGIVLQKNVLFSGTIRENLKWGDPSADDDALWAACRMACADEFLERMPKGLDTDLGQGGVNVSGGQKQRLCIARALLKHPKILIFDDSTSAVDTATEARIRASLAQLTDVTKIIIAQRVTSVMEADQIVILEDGRVHAVGTHDSLLASDPIYQEIYASQMKGGDGDGREADRR